MGFQVAQVGQNPQLFIGQVADDSVSSDPLAGTINDLNIPGQSSVSTLVLNASGNFTLNSLVGGSPNRKLRLLNPSNFIGTIPVNGGGTSANQFSAAVTLSPGTFADIVYSPTLSRWVPAASTTQTSGGTPGGANTQIQFNDTGTFGGDADFTWNKTNNILTIGSSTTPGSIKAPDVTSANGVGLTIMASNGNGTTKNGGIVTLVAGNGTGNATTDGYVVIQTKNGTLSIGNQHDLSFTDNVAGVDVSFFVNNTNTAAGSEAAFAAHNAQDVGVQVGAMPTAGGNSAFTNEPSGAYGFIFTDAGPLCFADTTGTINTMMDGGNLVTSINSLGATDTIGFLYVPLLVGNQTGVPAKLTGNYANSAPIRIQNNGGVYALKAYINGGWRSVTLV